MEFGGGSAEPASALREKIIINNGLRVVCGYESRVQLCIRTYMHTLLQYAYYQSTQVVWIICILYSSSMHSTNMHTTTRLLASSTIAQSTTTRVLYAYYYQSMHTPTPTLVVRAYYSSYSMHTMHTTLCIVRARSDFDMRVLQLVILYGQQRMRIQQQQQPSVPWKFRVGKSSERKATKTFRQSNNPCLI